MSKVKQRKMRLGIDPQRPYQETVVAVNYDSRKHRASYGIYGGKEEDFYITIPAIIADALGQKEVRAESVEACFKAFNEIIKRFETVRTEKSKVILYLVETSAGTGTVKEYYRDYSMYSVRFVAGIFTETVMISGTEQKRYNYEPAGDLKGYEQFHFAVTGYTSDGEKRYEEQVPWSLEAEAYFTRLAGRLQQLVDRMIELKDTEVLMKEIPAGKPLVTGQADLVGQLLGGKL